MEGTVLTLRINDRRQIITKRAVRNCARLVPGVTQAPANDRHGETL